MIFLKILCGLCVIFISGVVIWVSIEEIRKATKERTKCICAKEDLKQAIIILITTILAFLGGVILVIGL